MMKISSCRNIVVSEMGIYDFIQIVCLIGVLSAKKINEGFIRYETAGRDTERRSVFKTQSSEALKCAADCSALDNCDYYMYNSEQRTCKLHQHRGNVFHHKIGEIISVYWKAQCGKPPRTSHGRYTVNDKVAHYQCNENFKLFGSNDIKCYTSWPKGPKCLRHYWSNPFQRGHSFHAKIPWGFRDNGSISLSGRPKQKQCSFVILIGMKKESKPDRQYANFLLHLEVKVSQTNQQEIIIHTGSLRNKKNIWKPKKALYSFAKTTILEVRMSKNDFQANEGRSTKIALCFDRRKPRIHIDNDTFPDRKAFQAMVKYEEVKFISIFDAFKVETLKVHTA